MKLASSSFGSTLAGRLGLIGVAGIGILCLACSSEPGGEDELSDRERDRTTTAIEKRTATARANRTERAQTATPQPTSTPKLDYLHGIPLYPRLQAVTRRSAPAEWPCEDFLYKYQNFYDATTQFLVTVPGANQQCFTVGQDTLADIRTFYLTQGLASDWTVTPALPLDRGPASGFGQLWSRRNGLEQMFVGVMPSATDTGYVVLYAWSLK